MPLSEGVRRSPRARSARRAAADGRLSFDPLRQGCARLSAVCAACAFPLPFPFELRCPSRSARRSGHSYVRSLMRREWSGAAKIGTRKVLRRENTAEHDRCCTARERHFDSTGKFSGAFARARGKTPQCAERTARPDCCAPYGDHARKERRDTSARQAKP